MFSLNFISNLIKNAGGVVSDVYKESEKKKQEFKKEHKTISSISDFTGKAPTWLLKETAQAVPRTGAYALKTAKGDTEKITPGETGGLFGRLEKTLYGESPIGSVQETYKRGGGGLKGAGLAGLGIAGAVMDIAPGGGGKAKVGKEVVEKADDITKIISKGGTALVNAVKKEAKNFDNYDDFIKEVKSNPEIVTKLKEAGITDPRTLYDNITTNESVALESALKSREPLIKGQKEAVSVEKAIRSRRAEETLSDSSLHGVEGMNTYMKQLHGELPKQPEFESVVEKVGKDNIDKLAEGIRTSKNLQPYQKATTYEAFTKLLEGKAIQESEYDALGEHFGYKLVDQIKETKPKINMVVQILNTPRTVMASLDMSGARQGLVGLISHPTNIPKFVRDNFKYWGLGKGEQNLKSEMDKLYDLPHYNLLRKFKVDLSAMGQAVEEPYYGSLAEKIPVVGKAIRASERSFSGALTNLRATMANDLFEQALKAGKDPNIDKKPFEAIAKTVNVATGRGEFGKPIVKASNWISGSKMKEGQKNAVAKGIEQIASVGLFSPKLIASKLSMINPMYYAEKGIGKTARAERFRGLASLVGATLSMVAMVKMAKSQGASVDVETDPRSSNFLKIKVGNKTYIDLTGGQQAYIRVLAQALSGETKNIKTGKVKPLGVEYGSRDVGDVVSDFVRQKASPVASVAMNTATGKDTLGKPTNLLHELSGINSPLYLKDASQAFEAEGLSPALASTLLAGFFGGGTTTLDTPQQERESKQKTRAINRARKSRDWGFTDTFMNRLTGKLK
jgi:hypothetical protein